MPRNPVLEFNLTQIYFGKPYVIDLESAEGSITIYSPTIGDIIDIGDDEFMRTLNIFITNTTQYRLKLWEKGIDWNVLTDFELFTSLYEMIDPRAAELLFGDLDFKKFQVMMKKYHDENGKEVSEVILYNKEDGIEINQEVHNHISQYLRNVFGIFPEEKITNSQILKTMYIEKDKRDISGEEWRKAHQKDVKKSTLQATISTLINYPGFKYKLHELEDVGVAEFYDSARRIMIIEQCKAIMIGLNSGFVDGSKVKPEAYNMMREIY